MTIQKRNIKYTKRVNYKRRQSCTVSSILRDLRNHEQCHHSLNRKKNGEKQIFDSSMFILVVLGVIGNVSLGIMNFSVISVWLTETIRKKFILIVLKLLLKIRDVGHFQKIFLKPLQWRWLLVRWIVRLSCWKIFLRLYRKN